MKKKMKKMSTKLILGPATSLFKSREEEIIALSFLGKGEGSAVYKVETRKQIYCLKTALFPRRSQKVLNEATIRQNFIDRGLSFVPPPLFTDQTYFENGAVFYKFIEGSEPFFTSKEITAQMAKNLAEIHKLEFKILSDGKEQIWNNYRFLKKVTKSIQEKYRYLLNEKIIRAFDMALEEYKAYVEGNIEPISIGITSRLHGDAGDDNCIVDRNGKLWLIDWENSEYGNIVDEICGFAQYAITSGELQQFFYHEYQKHFPPAKDLDLRHWCEIHSRAFPAFNVCWGIDQLSANLEHKIEPERKLRDILSSARNWHGNFSEKATGMIAQGVEEMIKKLAPDLKKNG